jgi:hypothetical protein
MEIIEEKKKIINRYKSVEKIVGFNKNEITRVKYLCLLYR